MLQRIRAPAPGFFDSLRFVCIFLLYLLLSQGLTAKRERGYLDIFYHFLYSLSLSFFCPEKRIVSNPNFLVSVFSTFSGGNEPSPHGLPSLIKSLSKEEGEELPGRKKVGWKYFYNTSTLSGLLCRFLSLHASLIDSISYMLLIHSLPLFFTAPIVDKSKVLE